MDLCETKKSKFKFRKDFTKESEWLCVILIIDIASGSDLAAIRAFWYIFNQNRA